MFESIFKKKQVKPGNPGGNDKPEGNREDEIEAPEVDGTLGELDAALAAANKLKAAGEKEKARDAERAMLRAIERARGSSCGCG